MESFNIDDFITFHAPVGAEQPPPQPKKRKIGHKPKTFSVETRQLNGEQVIVVTFSSDEKIEIKQTQVPEFIRCIINASVEAHKKSLLLLLQ